MKILVVDRDLDLVEVCFIALRAQGHEVTAFTDPRTAIEAVRASHFDLALCDVDAGEHLEAAPQLIGALKESAPALPVIAISTLAPDAGRDHFVSAGADHHLQKPVQLEELDEEIAMAGAARARLSVVMQDADEPHARALEKAFLRAGCTVRVVAVPMQAMAVDEPDLVIIDAASPGAETVVRWAGSRELPCFVMFAQGRPFDDRLMRRGASLIVQKPVDADALLIQARFLSKR